MTTRPSGKMRVVAALLGVLAILGFVAFLGTQVVRGKLTEKGFYEATLREHHVYDRLYDDLLADPAFAPQLDRLLGGVDVKREDLAATIKRVVEPEYIRVLVESLIRGLVAYFRGEELAFALDITPIVEGIHGVAVEYAIHEIEETPVVPSPSLESFAASFQQLVTALASDGALPETIPSYPLEAEADRQLVAGVLLAAGQLDPQNPDHQQVIAALFDAIRRDDVALAIKVSCGAMLTQLITRAILQLTENPLVAKVEGEHGLRFMLSPPAGVTRALAAKLSVAQTAGKAAAWARIGGLAVLALSIVGIIAIFRGDRVRMLRWTGTPLVVAGALGFVAWLIGRGVVSDKVDAGIAGSKALPPSLRGIMTDVTGSVIDDLTPSFWIPSIFLLALGVAAVIGSVVLARRQR